MLRLAPWLTLLLVAVPALAGLLGTLAPAFGWLPAIGAECLGLSAWRELAAMPGLGKAVALTLLSGVGGTALALLAALLMAAALCGRPSLRLVGLLLPPLLAVPHLASALGFAFLIAPSGWLARLASPWLTGWLLPPPLTSVNDPWGLALTLGLTVREAPFLLFIILAAISQLDVARQLDSARSLGYGRAEACLRLLLPRVAPLLRLPLYAVLAFALSNVEVAAVLGPNAPAPLAAEILRLLASPQLERQLPAAAACVLLLILNLVAIAAFRVAEAALVRLGRGGGPSPSLDLGLRLAGGTCAVIVLAANLAGLLALALWSVAGAWRFPTVWPEAMSVAGWLRAGTGLLRPFLTSLMLGAISVLAALALVLACLEGESRRRSGPAGGLMRLAYLPLLLPQLSFLFGVQLLLLHLDLVGSAAGLLATHLLFVLPYTLLLLREPYLGLDPHYAAMATLAGRSRAAAFWQVKLPLLRRPIAIAAAVGFTVSLALYLPTVFAGGGRFATLATETLALAQSGDRRQAAVLGLVLAGLPLLAFGLAAAVPAPRLRRVAPERASP